jgi:hypothetical protein
MIFAVVVGCVAGCSASASKTGKAARDFRVLEEVNELLHASTGKRAPSKLADLNPKKDIFPHGYDAVKTGDVVVVWGTPLAGEGDAGKNESVLAYEKKVPTEGGYVLLSAGTIKKMTPDEFNATKGAKK